MRLILFDAGRNRRMTAVDSIPPVVSGPWQARMPTPDFVLEGTGVDACLTVLSGREGVAGGGLKTGAGLEMGATSLMDLRGVRWIAPDALSFRLVLRSDERAGVFERIFLVDLATEPARYVVRDLVSRCGADVRSIPSVERERVWVQVAEQSEGVPFLSVYALSGDVACRGDAFPVLVERCGLLLGRFSVADLTLGDYRVSDPSIGFNVDWLVADTSGVVRMSVVVERAPNTEGAFWEAMYEVTVHPDGRMHVECLSDLLDPELWTIL